MFAGNQGYQLDGELVKAGLILPLDEYAKAYGWDRVVHAGDAAAVHVDRRRRDVRRGHAVRRRARAASPPACSRTSSKLQDAGVDPASLKTFDDFDAALATLREQLPADEPVIALGNKDQYGAIHLWGMVQGAYTPAQEVRDWIFHKDGATFDTPGNLESLQKLKEWADKGYLGKGDSFNARNDAEAAAAFGKGEGAFMLGGNWNASDRAGRPRRRRGVLRHAARRERRRGRDRLGERADPHLGQDRSSPTSRPRTSTSSPARRRARRWSTRSRSRPRRTAPPSRGDPLGKEVKAGLGQARRGRRADAVPGLVVADDAPDDGPDLPGDAGRADPARGGRLQDAGGLGGVPPAELAEG